MEYTVIEYRSRVISGIELTYSLTRGEFDDEAGKRSAYGASIESSLGDRQEVVDITCDLGEASELFEKLIWNTVTPVTLRDIVEDWIILKEFT